MIRSLRYIFERICCFLLRLTHCLSDDAVFSQPVYFVDAEFKKDDDS